MRSAIALFVVVAGCSSDDGAAGPAAPTNLTVSPVAGGSHLIWTDNSKDEDQFVIMRKLAGAAMFDDLDMVPFNTTSYHDSFVTAGTAYTYMIEAINAAGQATSNEVTFTP